MRSALCMGKAGSRILQCVENGDFLSESLLHDEISDAPAEFYNYVEKIESFTQHHDGCVRESAAFALGLIGDARTLVEHARVEAQSHSFTFDEKMGVADLASGWFLTRSRRRGF